MRNKLKYSKKIFESFVELDFTNVQILNELEIAHGYPILDNYSNEISSLEPTDDFTQFLIFSELLNGKGRVSKVSA